MLYFFAKRPVFSFEIIVLWYAVNKIFYFINMHLINIQYKTGLENMWYIESVSLKWRRQPRILTQVGRASRILTQVGRAFRILTQVGRAFRILTQVGRAFRILTQVERAFRILTQVGRSFSIFTQVGQVFRILTLVRWFFRFMRRILIYLILIQFIFCLAVGVLCSLSLNFVFCTFGFADFVQNSQMFLIIYHLCFQHVV